VGFNTDLHIKAVSGPVFILGTKNDPWWGKSML